MTTMKGRFYEEPKRVYIKRKVRNVKPTFVRKKVPRVTVDCFLPMRAFEFMDSNFRDWTKRLKTKTKYLPLDQYGFRTE